MGMTKVYGASDDLIELDGTINDEIGCYNQTVHIMFDDGTAARIKYCKKVNGETIGVWGIMVLSKGTGFIGLRECYDEDADIYSDILTLDDTVKGFKYKKV